MTTGDITSEGWTDIEGWGGIKRPIKDDIEGVGGIASEGWGGN